MSYPWGTEVVSSAARYSQVLRSQYVASLVPRAFLGFRELSSGTKEDGGAPFIRECGSLAAVHARLGLYTPYQEMWVPGHGP